MTVQQSLPRKIDCIVGVRPNFVKIAPIMRALRRHANLSARLIHTGQHFDVAMNAMFFDELGIPEPDINLEVGGGTGTEQTARIMLGLEPVLAASRPDLLLVVGDVNSTMAAALVAAKLQIPLAHVEAGLRSGDRAMPEEINRLVTDRLADLLLTTERAALANLLREGIKPEQVTFVGNVMIDTLHASLARAVPVPTTLAELGAAPALIAAAHSTGFAFVTLHRPSNVDDPAVLGLLLAALVQISHQIPLVFPMHPRTQAIIAATPALAAQLAASQIIVGPPVSYLRAIGLMRDAKFAITDSGGVQEETTALGVPCLTVRENTERPITITEGTNILIGTDPATLILAAQRILNGDSKSGQIPEFWDGRAAERVVQAIELFLNSRKIS